MISVPWQWGQCRTCIIMLSLGWLEDCAGSHTPREHSRPTPLKHPRQYLAQGDLEHAIRVCTQGLTLSRASGNRNMLPQLVSGLGYAAALQGRHAEGRALL